MSSLNIPLVVDLDGTLIKSDLLFESFIALFKKNPFYIFYMLFWLITGKARLKNESLSVLKSTSVCCHSIINYCPISKNNTKMAAA